MHSIEYLDLPELIIPDLLISGQCLFESKLGAEYFKTSFILNEELLFQIKNIFPSFILEKTEGLLLQEIGPKFNKYVHKDPRYIAINYILELGGDNVKTAIVDGELEHSKVIPLNKWHYFHANQNHYVDNIITNRKSLSIGIKLQPENQALEWLKSKEIK